MTPAICESRAFIGAHQCPFSVSFNSFHKQIRHPECIEKISSTHLFFAVIFPELKKIIDIYMPRLKINSEGALSLTATLVNKAGCVIEDFEHGNEAISVPVCSTDVTIDATNI